MGIKKTTMLFPLFSVINELARDGNRSMLVLILISKQGKAIQLIDTCRLSRYANYKFKLAGTLRV